MLLVINPDLIIQEIDETLFDDEILGMVLPEKGNVAIWAADRLSATDSRLLTWTRSGFKHLFISI